MTSVKAQSASNAGANPGGVFDIDAVRAEFPILAHRSNGHALAYLDNAATTQKPRCVIDAISDFATTSNASVHRGVYELSVAATDAYEHSRAVVARFLGARSADEIIFVRGVTEAMNLLAFSLGEWLLNPGDEALVTVMEHHSNLIPWQQVCRRRSATLRAVSVDYRGDLRMDEFERLLTDRTRIVAVTHVSNVLGTVNPVRQIVRLAKQVGATTVIDGAQAASHLPIDVREIGCDFYAISGHKLYGPTGIGALYGRWDALKDLPPWQTGGSMVETVSIESATWAPAPARFEAGTPNISGAIGMAAAIGFLTSLDAQRVARHERALQDSVVRSLDKIKGVRVLGEPGERAPVVSFVVEGVHPHDLATILDTTGVAVRAGHHCCQPLMAALGLVATTRASMALYNQIEEVEALAHGVRGAIELLR